VNIQETYPLIVTDRLADPAGVWVDIVQQVWPAA
jgi:hypothetical protein